MEEHHFTEGAIRNGSVFRYCTHCDLMLFHYKDSKHAQPKKDTERAFYIEMAKRNNVE